MLLNVMLTGYMGVRCRTVFAAVLFSHIYVVSTKSSPDLGPGRICIFTPGQIRPLQKINCGATTVDTGYGYGYVMVRIGLWLGVFILSIGRLLAPLF